MQKVAIIGGGISGLSTAYYLSKINKSTLIQLFEGNKVGGLIQSQQKNGFLIENGPNYFHTDFSSLNLLNLIHEIGVFDYLIHSKVPSSDTQIWTNTKLQKFLPSPPFQLLKALTQFPVYRRALLKSWLKVGTKFKNPFEEIDISVKEFMLNEISFASTDDQHFIINTVVDALIQGTYAGDISKLSARFCYPVAMMYSILNEKQDLLPSLSTSNENVLNVILKNLKLRNFGITPNVATMIGGLKVLPEAIFKYLKSTKNIEIISSNVTNISEVNNKPVITTRSKSYEVDHVISTIPAKAFASIIENFSKDLSRTALSIPHNSIKKVTLGFSKLKVSGFGYLVPSFEQSQVYKVTNVSNLFPHLRKSVSIDSSIDSNEDSVIQEFKTHTGINYEPILVHSHDCTDSIPQYTIRHAGILQTLIKLSPNWLSVAGQSFSNYGIPNCVNNSKRLINDLCASNKLNKSE